jgi:hypothetical protein
MKPYFVFTTTTKRIKKIKEKMDTANTTNAAITAITAITATEQMLLNVILSSINLYIVVFLLLSVFVGLDTMARSIDEWRREMTYTSLEEGPDLDDAMSRILRERQAAVRIDDQHVWMPVSERWLRLSRRNRAKAQAQAD